MITPTRTGHPPTARAGRAARPAAVACFALAIASAATPAQADSLTAGRAITPPGTRVSGFSAATSPAGDRVALLYAAPARGDTGRDRLFARLGRAGSLGPARALEGRVSRSGAKQVEIFGSRAAVAADGSAVAAWIARGRQAGRDQLRVASAPPGGRFGPAQTLARASFKPGFVPEIAVTGVVAGADGFAVVSWSARRLPRALLRAAVRMPGGRFGAAQTLGHGNGSLVLAPSGTVLAAWIRSGTRRDAAVAASLRAGRRRFGATRVISGSDAAAQAQAVTGPGGAAVSWRAGRSPIRLRSARLRRDGTLAAARTIAAADTDEGRLEVDGPHVAFPLAGPVAAWQVFRDISEAGDGRKDLTRIDAAASRDGRFDAPRTLTPAGARIGEQAVAALRDRTLVAWSERVDYGGRLRLAVRRSGRGWGPPRTFADTSGAFAVAASRSSALLLWEAADLRLRLAIYRR